MVPKGFPNVTTSGQHYNIGEMPSVILYTYINLQAGKPKPLFFLSKSSGLQCVCVFSSHLFWTSNSLDVPAGVTQEEGHTGFLIHLLSAVRALIFLARRIQPFLSLVDREVEFCILTILIVLHPLGILFLFFVFLVRKIPFAGIELTSQRVRRLRLHGYL